MLAILAKLAAWYASGWIARILVGGGLTLLTATAVSSGVQSLLTSAASGIGAAGQVAQLILLGGYGDALSIIGSAIITRATLLYASRIIGIGRAAGNS